MPDRRRRHETSAAWLARASDEELLGLLSSGRLLQVGHGELCLPQDAGRVFVKLVPLTETELAPPHRGTTANYFELPTCYQYRIGSCGFGAWRELEVHRLANTWVLSGQDARFPLLHHARVLPVVPAASDDRRDLRVWGDRPAIHARVTAIDAATSSLVLFLEHFPTTLGAWLRTRLLTTANPAALLSGLEATLTSLLAFLHARGVLHLDAHLENVLTDGDQVVLADFGLALARDFELSAAEAAFFEAHQSFDRCTVISGLVHALVASYDARPDWRRALREDEAPAAARPYLASRTPLALALGDFYRRLLADLTTPYPSAAFDALLADLDSAREADAPV